jgi:hypothetical protein
MQGWLIALERQHVIAALIDNLVCDCALAIECIRGFELSPRVRPSKIVIRNPTTVARPAPIRVGAEISTIDLDMNNDGALEQLRGISGNASCVLF